jgi:hypothetical protein
MSRRMESNHQSYERQTRQRQANQYPDLQGLPVYVRQRAIVINKDWLP